VALVSRSGGRATACRNGGAGERSASSDRHWRCCVSPRSGLLGFDIEPTFWTQPSVRGLDQVSGLVRRVDRSMCPPSRCGPAPATAPRHRGDAAHLGRGARPAGGRLGREAGARHAVRQPIRHGGIIALSPAADRAVRYLAKYLAKAISDPLGDRDSRPTREAHCRRLYLAAPKLRPMLGRPQAQRQQVELRESA
jgi:hypothetical protein